MFGQVVREFELEPKCNNLTVAAYLLETVQRIPRYKLLIAGRCFLFVVVIIIISIMIIIIIMIIKLIENVPYKL